MRAGAGNFWRSSRVWFAANISKSAISPQRKKFSPVCEKLLQPIAVLTAAPPAIRRHTPCSSIVKTEGFATRQ